MLLAIFLEVCDQTLDSYGAAFAAHADPAAALEAMLPLDEERRMFWQVSLAFSGRVVSDAALKQTQADQSHKMRMMIERLLDDVLGKTSDDHERRFQADRLLATTVGIAVHGIYGSDRWNAERQRQHLRTEIEAIGQTPHLG